MKTLLKCITLYSLLFISYSCEKEDETYEPISQQQDYSLNALSLDNFLNSTSFSNSKEKLLTPQDVLQQKSGAISDNRFQFKSNEVLSTVTDEQTIYTAPLQKTNGSDTDKDHSLLVKENSFGTSSYLVTYSSTEGTITLQPIVAPEDDVPPNPILKCISVTITSGTYHYMGSGPCGNCGGSGTGYLYTESTSTTVTCWSDPIPVELDPPLCLGCPNPNSYENNPSIGYSNGGNPIESTPIQDPIYIFEGEEECFDDGTCTPPLYMPITMWETFTDNVLEDYNAFNNFINTLPQELQDFLSDITNPDMFGIRVHLQTFLQNNNYSDESKTFIEELVSYLNENPQLDITLDQETLELLDNYVVEAPDNPIDNMSEYLDCFDTNEDAINSTITVYVDEAVDGNNTIIGGDGVGHTFVSIQQGDNVVCFGFYPESGILSFFIPEVDSALGNDSNANYDVSISIEGIQPSTLNQIIDLALLYSNTDYNLTHNNCTDMAINLGNLAGLNLPDANANPLVFFGSTPGRLGEHLRNLAQPLPEGVSINTDGGTSPENNCN